MPTEPSNVGAVLQSAYPRSLQSLGSTLLLGAGLQIIQVPVPVALVPHAAGELLWPLLRNTIYRFSGSMTIYPAIEGTLSIESATMLALIQGSNGVFGFELANAARFGSVTALAAQIGISFDDFEIDCNDLLSLSGSSPNGATLPPVGFRLYLKAVLNNTGAAQNVTFQAIARTEAASFNSYKFSRWETQ